MITLFGLTFNIYAVLLIFITLMILYAIKKAQDDPESDFDWADLFTSVDQVTGKRKASVTKILQIIGGLTATFIVIKLTLQNNIEFEIFATYLAYVASIEGFSKFMIAKYGVGGGRDLHSDQYNSGYNRHQQNMPLDDRGYMPPNTDGYSSGQVNHPAQDERRDPNLPSPKPIEKE